MIVHRHAEASLVALSQKMPQPASAILARLRAEQWPEGHSAAVIVARLGVAYGSRNEGSNGDTVVVIVRDNIAITAMLRRSWNQEFTPEVLRVNEVIDWTQQKEKAA